MGIRSHSILQRIARCEVVTGLKKKWHLCAEVLL